MMPTSKYGCMAAKKAIIKRPAVVDVAFNEQILYDLLFDILAHHRDCPVPQCLTCARARSIKELLLVPFAS
jgi:hypothetical protein